MHTQSGWRRITVIAAVTVLSVLAASCGSDEPRQVREGPAAEIFDGDCASRTDQRVTVYSGRSENLIEPVIDAFSCETGIEIAVRWGGSSELALLIDEEGDRTAADVFLSRSPGPVGFLESRGHLSQVESDTLDLVSPDNRSSTDTWVGFSGRQRVLVYNVDAVSADELPASIFDLTGPEWKDRVAIPGTNGSFLDWFTIFRSEVGTDVATQWLDDMVANGATYYSGNRGIVEAAGRGEVDIGLVNHYYNYQEVEALGDDHRAANHEMGDDIGSILIITAATVTEAADNPEQANDFVAYLLSEPVQRYLTDETFEYPLAAGVEPADVLPALAGREVGSIDFDALGGGFEESAEIVDASGIANE